MDDANQARAQQAFREASEELQQLIRAVLEEERQVMHKQRRPNIHENIYKHVKRVIK